tara:strand:+ start:881 stop:3277 length:2397 start_codon:yes stop_codon:yes gene_type:complete
MDETTISSMDISVIIESITCPITGDIMSDPVQGNDGQTYERAAIIQALGIRQESPITRAPMTLSDLKVNASIRFLCDKYHQGAFGQHTNRDTTPPKISFHKIRLDHTISKNSYGKTMLTFNVDESSMPQSIQGQQANLSQDVVLVIDHSGSMDSAVTAKNENGDNLENGLSIQDIVNHAARTVANTLDKNSRLGVVIFDNRIETLFNLMLMTERNSSTACDKISTIKPSGQTNIWDALKSAIQMLNDREDKTRNGHIMMLTDGCPNISPSRGEIETLKRLRKSINFTAPIYTFGFGYNLQRGLLYNLAKYANGGNGHIPDGGMIATVFCNFLGTIMATIVLNLQLHITYSEDVNFAEIDPVMGDFAYNIDTTDTSNRTVIVDIGTVQLGQMRNIIMNTHHLKNSFSYFYTYKIGGQSFTSDKVLDVNLSDCDLNEQEVNIHNSRCNTVEMLRKIINYKSTRQDDQAKRCYNELEKYFTSSNMQDPLSKGIFENITDQVKLTVNNNNYYLKWGEFYLDQLSRSLNQQIKPNFKDQGCLFGGDIFTDLVDKASDVFDTLEPPEPSLINQTQTTHATYRSFSGNQNATLNGATAIPTRISTLAAYNNQSNPCFAGECTVFMANGFNKKIKDLVKGDMICSLSNPYDSKSSIVDTKVVCVLKTFILGDKTHLVTFDNGLKITPWHPMIYNGEWIYPSHVKDAKFEDCGIVYTIVLDGFHTFMVNNVWCITLGHGYNVGILQNKYYGTTAVINDLMKMPGWDTGDIIIDSSCIIRSGTSGEVTSIKSFQYKGLDPNISYNLYG